MNIWDADKLILFIAFVIPGFISLKIYELLNPAIHYESSKQIVEAITYSCVNYAILFWPLLSIERSGLRNSSPNLYSAFYLFALFGAPILLALFWHWLRKRQFIQKAVPHPTQKPWDYLFSKRKPYWVKVTLKDGTKIAGKYADNSFASSSPAEEQIYLEETWIVNENGGLERKKNQTAGVIILSKEIAFIEFMHY